MISCYRRLVSITIRLPAELTLVKTAMYLVLWRFTRAKTVFYRSLREISGLVSGYSATVKVGFHYPSWRPELTGVKKCTRVLGPSTRPVNSGSGNRPLCGPWWEVYLHANVDRNRTGTLDGHTGLTCLHRCPSHWPQFQLSLDEFPGNIIFRDSSIIFVQN